MADFSTPQGALLAIYEAYRAGDIDAAVACKDFRHEADLMFGELGASDHMNLDEEILSEMALTLEAAFRAEAQANGLPDLTGVTTEFVEIQEVQADHVVITERWSHPDGSSSLGRVSVVKGENGWRVLNPINEPAA